MKAMIFAAGKGERMLPLTKDTPKPLLKIKHKMLIEHHLEKISQAGIREVVINVAWMAEKIIAALGEGQRYGLTIEYSREDEPLETAGAILHAKPLLGSAPFLLVNADVFSDIDYREVASKTMEKDALAHLVLVNNPPHNPQGDYCLSAKSKIQTRNSNDHGFTFSGFSKFKPELVYEYPERRKVFPLREVFANAINENKLQGELFDGLWSDVGTPERLRLLEER